MILRLSLTALVRVLFALAFFTVAAVAQDNPAANDKPAEKKEAAEKVVNDPLGRTTPQGMVKGLMAALANRDYDRAVRYFEASSVPAPGRVSLARAQLARHFHEVLDRLGTVTTPPDISLSPEGNLNDGLADDLEHFGTFKGESGDVALLAKRVERDGQKIWLVSTPTLFETASLLRARGHVGGQQPWLAQVPAGPMMGGAPLSHWVALALIAIASFVLAYLLIRIRRPLFRLVNRRVPWEGSRLAKFLDAAVVPLRLLLAVMFFIAATNSPILGLSVVARYHGVFLAQFVGGIGLAWLLWRIAETASVFALDEMSRRGQVAAYSVVSFLKRIVQAAIVIGFVVVLIRSLGVDVTTALAALGIGGLAVALGAQKLFENLIGSLTLVADRPVRVGDFCRFGNALGTVEDIGIRSTRIRTLDRTVLTVPNGEFSAMQIENFASRDRFWFHPTLNLRYETSPEQVRYLLQELRAMLYAHPRVSNDPARVRFVALAAYSVDLEIFAYVLANSYDDYLEVQEDLLLRCMEIVNKSGTGFAFPSQTLYVSRDEGINAERTRNAEDAVRNWRDSGSLQIPRFDADAIRMLRETIAYPPEGAAINGKRPLAMNGNGVHVNGSNGAHVNGSNGAYANSGNGAYANGGNGAFVNGGVANGSTRLGTGR